MMDIISFFYWKGFVLGMVLLSFLYVFVLLMMKENKKSSDEIKEKLDKMLIECKSFKK